MDSRLLGNDGEAAGMTDVGAGQCDSYPTQSEQAQPGSVGWAVVAIAKETHPVGEVP